MRRFIIDGNNLIGKKPSLKKVQKQNPQNSREQLVRLLSKYFAGKKTRVSLHLDGFENGVISTRFKLVYSNNNPADLNIRREIENSKNPKLLTVISSDHEMINVARANSCKSIKSEDFWKMVNESNRNDSEDSIQRKISNEEIKKLFNVD